MHAAAPEPSVALLADHTGLVDRLARWYEREWAPYYGPQGPGDARADLLTRCKRKRLPIGFVALQDDRLLGAAALDRDTSTGRTPSIVGLLVAPDWQRRGVASALLDFAEGLGRELGHDELFISTAVLGQHLLRTGWQQQGDVEFLNGERGKTYVRQLAAH